MYGQGGSYNPHFRHVPPPQQPLPPQTAGMTGGFPQKTLPPPPPQPAVVPGGFPQQTLPPPPPQPAAVPGGFPQQTLPPPPPQQAGVPSGFPQQTLRPPPVVQYMRHPPPPGPYQHGMPPLQHQAYPYAPPGQMHHMPMLPQQRGYGHVPLPGPPLPPQAMYQARQQYPMPGSLPPPPPRPPSFAPDDVPPPPPPSPPPLVPPEPPAAPTTPQSCSAEVEGKESSQDGGRDVKIEESSTPLIVSDDSDMDMDGDEDSPSRVHLGKVNSSAAAAAECTGDINAANPSMAENCISSLGSDLLPGSSESDKSKNENENENVTVEGGSQLQLLQGYASDDSEDEKHTVVSSNLVTLPEYNEPSHPSDRNSEIGHQQVIDAEGNVNTACCNEQNNEARTHLLEDDRNPVKHVSDKIGHLVKETSSGNESAGTEQDERHGRTQMKRSRNDSPQARSCSPCGEDKHSPSQSSLPGRQSRSPLAKRANLNQSKSPQNISSLPGQSSLLPGQPFLATAEFPQTQQLNVMAPANEFLQNQMKTYPAADLSHPRPLDFRPHATQPVVPSELQPPALHTEFNRPFPLDSVPVPLPDGRPEFSGGVGLSYSSHQPSYGPQQPPGSLASGANMVYQSFQIFPSNLPGSSDFGPVSDAALPKSSIKTHYNPFASTFEQTDPTLDIGPVISPKTVGSASARTGEQMNTLSPFGQSVPGSGTCFNESSADAVLNRQKQAHLRFSSRGTYDPLLDSIEPSSNSINKVGQEGNLSATGSRNTSKLVNIEVESKNMHGLGLVAESEVEELGEVAADTETGVVENVSPEPQGAKDWSSDIPGDMDNDQSLDVSKKSKDSRSMRLLKTAIADFVKEVLKPSWRQGNMSRDAFKIIVKKTVDKVSNSVPSNHVPKTPAKIKQYIQSSQRKVTKLVMGYVEKYAKV